MAAESHRAPRHRVGGLVALGLVGLATVALPAHGSTRPGSPVLSARVLLDRLVDPAAALRPLPPGLQVLESSSHDRRGANGDDATFDPLTGHTGTSSYLYADPTGFVVFDRRGPGCVTRMFLSGLSGTDTGGIANWGRLQFLFDGARRPRIDLPATRMFSGHATGFPRPVVGDATVSSGGAYSYVPICFRNRLVIRAAGTSIGLHFFHIDALVGPAGTPVEEYGGSAVAAAIDATRRLMSAGQPPAGHPSYVDAATLTGSSPLVERLSGSGSIRYVEIGVRPFTEPVLQATRLQITADGASRPQVDVPLGDLFGDGTVVRRVRSLAFGMDPASSTGYFALPAPYARDAVVRLVTTSTARVRLRVWTGPTIDTTARLVGARHVEHTRLGEDYTVLAAHGSGRIASWVLDYIGQLGSTTAPSGQTYLEGDARIFVDGARSPSFYGTGTEDEFNAGFYFVNGPFTLPTHGAGPAIADGLRTRQSAYRVFGLDGPLWSRRVRFGMEHGAGDESDPTVANTVFSYRAAPTLTRTDTIDPADLRSVLAHRLMGRNVGAVTLSAYFEGPHDGNLTAPIPLLAGEGIAPPAAASREGVTATGLRFAGALGFTVSVTRGNDGVVLRRLTDAGAPSTVRVLVDGRPAGLWVLNETNVFKRWREDSFALPPRLTVGRSRLRITLAPPTGTQASVFGLSVWSIPGQD